VTEAEQAPGKAQRGRSKDSPSPRRTSTKAASQRRTGASADRAKAKVVGVVKRAGRPKAAKKTQAPVPEAPDKGVPRLLERLRMEIGPQLVQEFGYASPMQIPRLEKVVLNMGLGEAKENSRAIENASRDLGLISSQRPVTTRAKKSIAGFKIRQGEPVGISVTLRGRRMYEFVDRLLNSALPRIRDLQGVSTKSFDGRGNYSLGIREHVIFPEIDYNSIDRIRSLQVIIVTTATTDQEAAKLLELMGMPFARSLEPAMVA